MVKKVVPNQGYPYLDNLKADVRLLGIVPLINPFMDKLSSQRGMMMSDHLSQALVVNGCELPRCYTGFEHKIGKYSIDYTERDQAIQVLAVIPKFILSEGAYPVYYNPSRTVVYRGVNDSKIGCFDIEDFTTVTDDFGYRNVYGDAPVNVGNILSENDDIVHAPTHSGSIYKLFGCNLNVAYMAIPQVTEDGIAISESAAKKLETEGYSTISIDIGPGQIPLNLYGDETSYKFMPDIGNTVHEDGVVCALRTPTADSIVHDTSPNNLKKIQHLHDKLYRIPAGAEILDIYVCINRKNKPVSTIKTDIIYQQAEIYRQKINTYHRSIYNLYHQLVDIEGYSYTDAFNSLVYTAAGELLSSGERLDNTAFLRKNGVLIPLRNKAEIDFIHIDIKYRYKRPVRHGFKLTGRFGNKGVVSKIIPDNECPVDAEGFRADIIIDPVSVFNRMNPGQQYEQFINRGNELLRRRVEEVINTTKNYEQAFSMMVEWASDINPNYAKLLEEINPTLNDKASLVNDTIKYGFFMQIAPFTDGINQEKILYLSDKYNIKASNVTYTIIDENHNKKNVTTKQPVLIGEMFTLLLNKIPHLRACGIGYINNFRTPAKSGSKFNSISPYSITAIRIGEDEIRNIAATAGGDVAAIIHGMYGNNKEALDMLATTLLTSPTPSSIKNINMSLADIIHGNNMVNVTKHMFGCFGIDIAYNKGE